MKKTQFKKILALTLTLILVLGMTMSAAAADEFNYRESEYGSIFVNNEYIEYCISNTGFYTIGTTGGNPNLDTDNNKYLLYDHGDPGTSYATVVIDGEVFVLGSGEYDEYDNYISENIIDKKYDSTTGSYTVTYKYGEVEIQQIFTIIDNNSTGRKDVVELKYVVTNKDTQSHNVGFRIMLDTMLADNDHAPFRVPGTGDVTTETEYEGSDIPQYWQAFDSLESPSTIAQGTFLRAGYAAPDKVQFCSWWGVTSIAWEYVTTPGNSNGDSAVTATWYEKEIAAGQKETYVTYYGLSELQQVTKELSLALYTDASVDVNDGAYTPNPTVATAYIKNVSDYAVDNVVIDLATSAPLSVDSATPATITIGTLAAGEEKQISWNLDIATVSADTNVDVTATLSGTDVETLTVSRTISIPGISAPGPVPGPDPVPTPDDPDPNPICNFFQKIWAFFMKIFVFLGLS